MAVYVRSPEAGKSGASTSQLASHDSHSKHIIMFSEFSSAEKFRGLGLSIYHEPNS